MAIDLAKEFGSNEKAEIEGVKVFIGEGGWVKVARLGNPETQKAYRRIPRGVRRQIEEGTMTDAQSTQFLSKFLADHVLKAWGGLEHKGKSLGSYTSEKGYKTMMAERRFRDKVWELSNDDELFNVGDLEEDVKN